MCMPFAGCAIPQRAVLHGLQGRVHAGQGRLKSLLLALLQYGGDYRSTRDLLNILNRLDQKQVKLHVIDQQIDTSTPAGMLLVTMLGAIAAFENDLRKERQTDGIALAKRRGVQFGRRPVLNPEQILEMRQKRSEGVKIGDLMKVYGVSKASVYRALDT